MKHINYKEIEDYFIEEKEENSIGHKILQGTNEILLTAPHSVDQIREGNIKVGEYRTGLIVKLLGRKSDCHIAYKTKNLNDDANYNKDCNFKKDILRYIRENQIMFVLDFHLSRPDREFALDIGTGKGLNIRGGEDKLKILLQSLSEKYSPVKVDEVFPASYPHTVSATVARELGIPAMQIEINWKIVDDYDKVDEFIETLLKIIRQLEEKI